MHEIDDRLDPELVHQVRNDLVGPAPVEFAAERFYPVPRDPPAHGARTDLACQCEIGAPVVVVSHQLVLIEGAVTRAGLRHEGILDARGPDEIFRPPPETGRVARPARHRSLSAAVRGNAMNCSCWAASA